LDILTIILYFVIGLAALYFGGEGLVRGASNLARMLGISPMVIGLTVVAFGTSSPEFLVCIMAALQGSSDIVIGNILGSNISNIALILGVSAILCPIVINIKLIKVEVPIMIFLTLLLYVLSIRLQIGRIAGGFLFAAIIAFTVYSYYAARKEPYKSKAGFEEIKKNGGYLKQAVFLILGLAGLIIGARLLVDSAITLAQMFGISEFIIGITAVAIGTSLPELSTSIVAALRKEQDIIVGNIIGSNIFNIGILGLVSVIQPITVEPSLLRFEFPVMIFFTILVLPLMRIGFRVSKIEGVALLLLYAVFMFLLFNPIWL
jgi:cation:H+ antiporter